MRESDRRWITELLAGELAAWHRLDEWVVRAAAPYRGRLGDEWADVLQDVRTGLLQFLRNGRFRGESSLQTFLWRVTGNACLLRLRRLRRGRTVALDPLLDPPAPAWETPEERVLRADQGMLALRVAMEVPAECRRLWRWLLAGHSYPEMAAALGVATGTLRVRMHRCRKAAARVRDRLLARATGNEWVADAPNEVGGP